MSDPKLVKKEMARWSGLFKKTVQQRQGIVQSFAGESTSESSKSDSSSTVSTEQWNSGGLSSEQADFMVENCIGTLSLPLSVAPHFVVNGKYFAVPMSTEEPSVVAAASGAGKFVASAGGGFNAVYTGNFMEGQIQLVPSLGVTRDYHAKSLDRWVKDCVVHVKRDQERILAFANSHCASMVKRGGGVVGMRVDTYLPALWRPYLVVTLKVNVCDAMGANKINTICEAVAPYLQSLCGKIDTQPLTTAQHRQQDSKQPTQDSKLTWEVGMQILTNLARHRRVYASFRVPVSKMGYKGRPGHVVANNMIRGYMLACDSVDRAVTHNKGIMNGVDAVLVACGQDYRAVEASAHTWASRVIPQLPRSDKAPTAPLRMGGQYSPLSHYWLERGDGSVRYAKQLSAGSYFAWPPAGGGGDDAVSYMLKPPSTGGEHKQGMDQEWYFCGCIDMPMAVGTVGGALGSHPLYKTALRILRSGKPVTGSDRTHSEGKSDRLRAAELATVVACVGLAQNFAALRALSTEGIQRGHMSLHARNVAIAAQVPKPLIDKCVAYMTRHLAGGQAPSSSGDKNTLQEFPLLKGGGVDVRTARHFVSLHGRSSAL